MLYNIKITNMTSPRTGREVANQFLITDTYKNKFFQSYGTMISKIGNHNRIYLDKHYWNYSNTTNKYRNQFLHRSTEEIKADIKSGLIKLVDLNKCKQSKQYN